MDMQEVSIVLVYWESVYRHIWNRLVHIHMYRLMHNTTNSTLVIHLNCSVSFQSLSLCLSSLLTLTKVSAISTSGLRLELHRVLCT